MSERKADVASSRPIIRTPLSLRQCNNIFGFRCHLVVFICRLFPTFTFGTLQKFALLRSIIRTLPKTLQMSLRFS